MASSDSDCADDETDLAPAGPLAQRVDLVQHHDLDEGPACAAGPVAPDRPPQILADDAGVFAMPHRLGLVRFDGVEHHFEAKLVAVLVQPQGDRPHEGRLAHAGLVRVQQDALQRFQPEPVADIRAAGPHQDVLEQFLGDVLDAGQIVQPGVQRSMGISKRLCVCCSGSGGDHAVGIVAVQHQSRRRSEPDSHSAGSSIGHAFLRAFGDPHQVLRCGPGTLELDDLAVGVERTATGRRPSARPRLVR